MAHDDRMRIRDEGCFEHFAWMDETGRQRAMGDFVNSQYFALSIEMDRDKVLFGSHSDWSKISRKVRRLFDHHLLSLRGSTLFDQAELEDWQAIVERLQTRSLCHFHPSNRASPAHFEKVHASRAVVTWTIERAVCLIDRLIDFAKASSRATSRVHTKDLFDTELDGCLR